jgi:hypothetical protein
MSTETQIQDPIVDDNQDPDLDAPVVDGEGQPAVPPEKPFQAWDLPKPEPTTPRHVPYDRFAQVNTEKTELFEDNRALAKRNQELQAEIEKLSNVQDPDELDPNDFADPKEYLKAYSKGVAAKARAEVKQELAESEQDRIQQAQVQELGSRFQTNLQAQAAEDPNVTAAASFFDQYADQVAPAVGRELLADPNVGHVMVRLATNKDLLNQFFSGTPDQAIRLINRISARIEAERELRPAASPAEDGVPVDTPARRGVPAPLRLPEPDARAQIRNALPAQVRATPAAGRIDLYKDAENMSMAQYRAARKAQKV